MNSRKVSIRHPNFKFEIVSFKMSVAGYYSLETTGPKLTKEMRSILKNMEPGEVSFSIKFKGESRIVVTVGSRFVVE